MNHLESPPVPPKARLGQPVPPKVRLGQPSQSRMSELTPSESPAEDFDRVINIVGRVETAGSLLPPIWAQINALALHRNESGCKATEDYMAQLIRLRLDIDTVFHMTSALRDLIASAFVRCRARSLTAELLDALQQCAEKFQTIEEGIRKLNIAETKAWTDVGKECAWYEERPNPRDFQVLE